MSTVSSTIFEDFEVILLYCVITYKAYDCLYVSI